MVVSTSLMQFFLDPLNPITCFWISCGVTCVDHLHMMMMTTMMMMMMMMMTTMMTHLHSPPILLNDWWRRLPLVSRHSEKRQMCLTNVFDESRSSAKIANYCPLLPTRQRRGVRVAGFPQNIDHAGDSKTHPIEGMSFHVYRTLTITPLPT